MDSGGESDSHDLCFQSSMVGQTQTPIAAATITESGIRYQIESL